MSMLGISRFSRENNEDRISQPCRYLNPDDEHHKQYIQGDVWRMVLFLTFECVIPIGEM
jgi:hypothetical protein